MIAEVDRCLLGQFIYGDDFGEDEIANWYEDEESAYTDITGDDAINDFGYQQWAVRYGYRHLPKGRRFPHVVGFGAGRGNELEPMDERVDRITIIESSDRYSERGKRLTSPTTFVRAHPSGDIALPDEDADLVVCLGVLHHIPNVTHVLSEFARILSPGGYLILREPVISMGDWRQPRPGLTPRERGIPRKLLADAVRSAGFNIQREALIGFPLIANTWQWLGKPPYNNRAWTILDRSICTLTTPNLTYHATSSIRKLRPTSAAIVAQRR